MIRDEVKVKLAAGHGGSGHMSFDKMGMPSGGNGGKGGDIYIEGSVHLYDYHYLNNESKFAAESGARGGDNNKTGPDGKDITLKVPLTTEVYNAESGELLTKITTQGQRELVLRGGRGGLGNKYFRRGQMVTLEKTTQGRGGGAITAKLILKLKGDVVFIGLPNAGKSSILNAITDAHVKVAAYPFTTLEPFLGTIPGLVLIDLPGLIEGTAQGKGLGSGFAKHTEYAKLVAHIISLESTDVVKGYETIREELKQISASLYEKPEIIVLTKTDLLTPAEVEDRIAQLKQFGKPIFTTSILDETSTQKLEQDFRDQLKSLPE